MLCMVSIKYQPKVDKLPEKIQILFKTITFELHTTAKTFSVSL